MGDIAFDLLYGTSEKSLSEGLVPVLRMGNINRIGEIDWNNLVYTSNQADIAKYSLKQDDLLFNRTNSAEWVGKTAIYKGNKNAIYAGYIIRIRTISVNADYINYVMNSSYHRDWCDEVKTDAVNQSNINAQKLSQLYIPIPPYKEQERIVNSVQKWTMLINNIEKEKSDLAFSVAETKSKILDLAIHGKLVPQVPMDEPAPELLKRINPKAEITCDNPQYGKLPNGWCETLLGNIGTWQSGATPSRLRKDYYGGSIPWLKTGDLNDGIVQSIPECITEIALEETPVKLNPAGSILIAMYGATIGRIGILSKPATTNQACCACVDYLPEKKFLFYFLLANRENFIAMGGGGAQPNISKEKIIHTHIPLPPQQEQHRIVAQIEKLFAQLDNIASSL